MGFCKLKSELPMTSAMYITLVNKVAKTTLYCAHCHHHNGECVDFAMVGACKAMDKCVNDVLVFHDGCYEFATTRYAVSRALEANQENDENPWIGKTVDAVIEDYLNESEFGKENVCAASLHELLSTSDILAELLWETIDKVTIEPIKDTDVKIYPLTFLAEEAVTVYVNMTENEAAIVERVLDEANELKAKEGAYCGSVIFSASEGMTEQEFAEMDNEEENE